MSSETLLLFKATALILLGVALVLLRVRNATPRGCLPRFDHTEMTYEALWYLRGLPEAVPIRGSRSGSTLYEIHFTLSATRSPMYDDRSYDTRYRAVKHGKTVFTRTETEEFIKWMCSVHSMAHDDY